MGTHVPGTNVGTRTSLDVMEAPNEAHSGYFFRHDGCSPKTSETAAELTGQTDASGRDGQPSNLAGMGELVRIVTAGEMDEMTPDERAAVVAERSSLDLDSLPEGFRRQVVATAKRLAGELDSEQPS